MRAVSALLGGRSVAIAQYQTSDAAVPLTVSARGQEPVVVTLGDEEWELPDR
jgi:hypothetical protein